MHNSLRSRLASETFLFISGQKKLCSKTSCCGRRNSVVLVRGSPRQCACGCMRSRQSCNMCRSLTFWCCVVLSSARHAVWSRVDGDLDWALASESCWRCQVRSTHVGLLFCYTGHSGSGFWRVRVPRRRKAYLAETNRPKEFDINSESTAGRGMDQRVWRWQISTSGVRVLVGSKTLGTQPFRWDQAATAHILTK